MEETVIVIMQKSAETGFLEKEMGAYSLPENIELVYNIYVEGDEKTVTLRLTCDKVLEDWEYHAVYDYYDAEELEKIVDSFAEEEGHFEPVWVIQFPFVAEQDEMEQKLAEILQIHKKELLSVYEAIQDKEDDYCEKE